MICAQCGNSEPEDAAYCSNCGAALVSPVTSQGEASGPAPEQVKLASAPPPQTIHTPTPTDPYQEDYERAKAAGFPKPQSQAQDRAGSKGFMASLFDFGFTSFVTPKIVKVVYVLVMILLGLSELIFAVATFRISPAFGIIALFILCPVFFLIDIALWRILLEIVMVIFRIAEDLRSIRARGDLHQNTTEAAQIGD